jgi:photosynthetic reaction center cytochrome c subunit
MISNTTTALTGLGLLAAAALVVFVPVWQPPPHPATQISLPSGIQFAPAAAAAALNQAPPALPAAASGGPMATATYKNVQVLTDVSAAEFMRLQTAITQWVAPKQGCSFCHAGTDYASDAKPEKAAARLMLQMVRHINADWANHVQPAGVTCYTCHRGQPVPPEIWFPDAPPPVRPLIDKQENWQENADTVRKFFPDAGWSEYFLQDEPIAVQAKTALHSNTASSYIEAKRIYEMMMQLSDGIGVNCGYCHNSRAFASWDESSPFRWIGFYAIKLVRDLNQNFLLKVAQVVPQTRALVDPTSLPVMPARETGQQQGNGLVICATCHYGLPKPLNGAAMLDAYPGLTGPHAPPPG